MSQLFDSSTYDMSDGAWSWLITWYQNVAKVTPLILKKYRPYLPEHF